MNAFQLFFPLGIEHISDLNGYDHILFVAALCLRYQWQQWRTILLLITAFTIGHSVTLALSTLQVVNVQVALTEFCIALSILITALLNLLSIRREERKEAKPNRLLYVMALVFGLIHGLGFSTLLKSMLGTDESIVVELLAFNLGLEVGQLAIVAALLLAGYIFVQLFRMPKALYVAFVSGAIAALSIQMALERNPFTNYNKSEHAFRLDPADEPAAGRRQPGHPQQSQQ